MAAATTGVAASSPTATAYSRPTVVARTDEALSRKSGSRPRP